MYDIEQQPATRNPARKPKRRALPPGCSMCRGFPWLSGSLGDVAQRCSCPRGQWYREADRKREAAI